MNTRDNNTLNALDVEYIDQRRERLETIAILALSVAGISVMIALAVIAVWSW